MKEFDTFDEETKKKLSQLTSILKDKYAFFGITVNYVRQLLFSNPERLKYDCDSYIKEVDEILYDEIRNALLDGNKLYSILFDYIQNNFIFNNNYNDQLTNMSKLIKVLKTVNIVPSQIIIERLLFTSTKLSNACKIIVNKDFNYEKGDYDNIIIIILKTYNNCLNIEDKYLKCDMELNNNNNSQSATDIYLAEVKKIPLLSYDDEKKLMLLIKEGNRDARKRMAEANLRLVVSIAIKIYNDNKAVMNSMSLSDIISEGNIGLLKAIDKFDPTLGYKFSTYATWWIRQAILKSIKDKGRMIRIPFNFYPMLKQFRLQYELLETKLKRPPSIKELATSIGISETRVRDILHSIDEPLSINDLIAEDTEMGDFIPSSYDLNEEIEKKDLKEQLINFIKNAALTSREKMVILMRNELYDGKKYSLNDIAKILNISNERVNQIERRAYHKLALDKNRSELEKFLVYLDDPEKAKIYLDEVSKKVAHKAGIYKKKTNDEVAFKPLYSYFEKYDRLLFDLIINNLSPKYRSIIDTIYGTDFDNTIIINNPSYKVLNNFNTLLHTIENILCSYSKTINDINFYRDVIARKTSVLYKYDFNYDKLKGHDKDAFLAIIRDIESRLCNYNKNEYIKNVAVYFDADSLLISSYDYNKLIELLNGKLFMNIIRFLDLNSAIIIALKLGYVNNRYYKDDQICAILKISKERYNDIIESLISIYNLNIDKINKKVSTKILRKLDN